MYFVHGLGCGFNVGDWWKAVRFLFSYEGVGRAIRFLIRFLGFMGCSFACLLGLWLTVYPDRDACTFFPSILKSQLVGHLQHLSRRNYPAESGISFTAFPLILWHTTLSIADHFVCHSSFFRA